MAVCNNQQLDLWLLNLITVSWGELASGRQPSEQWCNHTYHSLKWAVAFTEQSASSSDNTECAHLNELWGETSSDADPVDGGNEAVSGHRAEDERAQLLPLLTEVMRVDLSEEDGQDHGQDRD